MKYALMLNTAGGECAELEKLVAERYELLRVETSAEVSAMVRSGKQQVDVVIGRIPELTAGTGEFLQKMGKMPEMTIVPFVAVVDTDAASLEAKLLALGAADCVHLGDASSVIEARIDRIEKVYEIRRRLARDRSRIAQSNLRIIDVMASLVESRDISDDIQPRRVRGFTRIMMETLRELYPIYDITDELIESVTLASALHDIGKIAVSDAILLKSEKLTESEYRLAQNHTVQGADIIARIEQVGGFGDYFAFCRDICLHHHERYDGSGYPHGLAGEENLIYTQIVALADVYTALVDDRPYRKAMTHEEAVSMICSGKCGVFSPILIDCFTTAQDQIGALTQPMENA